MASGQDAVRYSYEEPRFGLLTSRANQNAITPVHRDELQALFSDIVWHPQVNGKTRGQALALAYALGSRRDVIMADFYFRYGHALEDELQSFAQSPTAETTANLIVRVGQFIDNLPPSGLNTYLEDIRTGLYDNGNPPSADWTGVLGERESVVAIAGRPNRPEMIFFEEPGGVTIDSSGEGFKRRQSLITGLLVLLLEGSNYAGGASQMNATVVQGIEGQPTRVMFNQAVGEMMSTGLDKVVSYIDSHEAEIPTGHRVEISFESQYSPKDGDSASVACALLLSSLIKADEIDSGFAVTGALETDGTVKAVGGIDGKIRGATARKCSHVAIPSVNEDVLLDMLLIDGPEPMTAIQVFTIETFDQAKALAAPPEKRNETLQQAMDLFSTIQRVFSGSNGLRMLQNNQVQQRLREVLELAPNHASAKILLLSAMGKGPRQLSLRGSLTALDRAALPLIQGLENDGFRGASSALETDEFATASYQLKRLRPKLDSRAWGAADAIGEFSDLIRLLRNNPPRSNNGKRELATKLDRSSDRIQSEYDMLVKEVEREAELEED